MMSTGLRALIVEDDPSWQHLLGEMLADIELVVDVAGSLEEAISRLHVESYRLAIVDLCLSRHDHHNRDGLKVLQAIQEYSPSCTSILLTGHATVEIAVAALTEQGAYTCLRKESFSRTSFRKLLQQALAAPAGRPGSSGARLVEDVGAPAAAHNIEAANASARGSALVLEDDAGWRSILSELLSEAGYQVRLCNGYGEALGCLGRDRYDLAVVDLSLDGTARPISAASVSARDGIKPFDGLRLLTSARAAGVPTIVVSGMGTPAEIERLYAEHGIFSYLQKQTFDRGAFLRAISEICEAGEPKGELEQLTERERQVLALLAQGMTNKEIAATLMISPNTVKRHLKAIFAKLGIRTRAAAVTRALSAGLTAWHNPDVPQTG